MAYANAFGGVLIGNAIANEADRAKPISKVFAPPNALAYAKGFIQQKDMAIVGIIAGVLGLLLGYVVLIFVGKAGLL